MGRDFIDSNVLVYLASADVEKADRAEKVLAAGGMISVQVLNEVANVARRKMHMSWEDLHAFIGLVRRFVSVLPLTLETHETGLALAERYGLSTYGAMIAASAMLAGCRMLHSEDMQHGLHLGPTLQISNPFLH